MDTSTTETIDNLLHNAYDAATYQYETCHELGLPTNYTGGAYASSSEGEARDRFIIEHAAEQIVATRLNTVRAMELLEIQDEPSCLQYRILNAAENIRYRRAIREYYEITGISGRSEDGGYWALKNYRQLFLDDGTYAVAIGVADMDEQGRPHLKSRKEA
ncbi:hypothetical protein [Bifidobacterium fermentum]|uniref:Uncharacterized protein n=1 Tax=Bifidobacterium fermentum TaxID=3059035 RepID=A0AB39UFI8_9BIFI